MNTLLPYVVLALCAMGAVPSALTSPLDLEKRALAPNCDDIELDMNTYVLSANWKAAARATERAQCRRVAVSASEAKKSALPAGAALRQTVAQAQISEEARERRGKKRKVKRKVPRSSGDASSPTIARPNAGVDWSEIGVGDGSWFRLSATMTIPPRMVWLLLSPRADELHAAPCSPDVFKFARDSKALSFSSSGHRLNSQNASSHISAANVISQSAC
ncbi:hypothetical protein B0H13DRAFT_2561567 [Mycena leptocephala]|nr:hypothetical protein B0H13DRAFT_2561567 [Mycena leptocephala]